MNNTNTINSESEAGMFCCSETDGYLLPLLNLPFNTPCLIFHCDFIDGTAGAWVSTDVATPLHEQVQSYLQSRRIRGLTTNTTFGIYSFHCRYLGWKRCWLVKCSVLQKDQVKRLHSIMRLIGRGLLSHSPSVTLERQEEYQTA